MKEKIKAWWAAFRAKQKFAILDPDSGDEKFHFFISPARVVIGAVSIFLVLVIGLVVLIAYTPMMDNIPGYPGRRSRQMLVENIVKLDSLERAMGNLSVYSNNIDLIMQGKTPVIRDVTRIGDSISAQEKTAVGRNFADSLLRAQMQGPGGYNLAASAAASRTVEVAAPELVPPAKGVVRRAFSPVDGHFGVEIVTAADSPVVVTRDGSVIGSSWAPEVGWTVQVQHADNLVSVYRRLTQTEKPVGTRVKAGEIIGTASPLEFELWYNGTAADPQKQIAF